MAAGWCGLAFLALPGCKSSGDGATHSRGVLSPSATQSLVVGDWNDVFAAIQIALGKNEAALLGKSQSDTEQTFEFKFITDDRGTLTARRDSPAPLYDAPDLGPIPIHLSCSVGFWGDPAREKAILDAMRQRLEQLSGVDWAPVK